MKHHFHIYFEKEQLEKAESLVKKLKEIEFIEVGRVWNKPVGPHPIGSCQITVLSTNFYEMTEWFLNNREQLSIFVHAVTGNDIKDHTDYVMWIGKEYKLNLDFFTE